MALEKLKRNILYTQIKWILINSFEILMHNFETLSIQYEMGSKITYDKWEFSLILPINRLSILYKLHRVRMGFAGLSNPATFHRSRNLISTDVKRRKRYSPEAAYL